MRVAVVMTPLDAFVHNVIVPALVEQLLKSEHQTPTIRKKELACSSVAS